MIDHNIFSLNSFSFDEDEYSKGSILESMKYVLWALSNVVAMEHLEDEPPFIGKDLFFKLVQICMTCQDID